MRCGRLTRSTFLFAWCVLCALGAAATAQSNGDKAALDRAVADALGRLNDEARVLHNRPNFDATGCYRTFKGGLIVARTMLGHRPEIQKELDDGLAAAEKLPLNGEGDKNRNLAIHNMIQAVRKKLRATASETSPDVKPVEPIAKGPGPVPLPPKTDPVPPPKTEPSPAPKTEPPPAPKVDPVPPPKTDPVPPKTEPAPKTEPPSPPPSADATLWKKMGGEEKFKKIVDDFVTLTADDKEVDFTRGGKFKFDDAKLKDLKDKLVGYFSSITDGTVPYTGKSMPDAHKDMNITQKELDRAIDNLRLAAEKQGVAAADLDDFIKKVKAKSKEFLPPAEEKKDEKKDEKKEDKKDDKPSDKKDDKPN